MTLSHHTLTSYDRQLEQLLRLILDMGGAVRKMIASAKQSLRERDESRIADAKAADKLINDFDARIDEAATVVLALQNPMAIDLRFVVAVLKITTMLERMGDLAKNTIKRSVKMGAFAPEPIILKLERMADVADEMLASALEAFAEKNTDKAIRVWQRDEEIDALYKEVFALMQKNMVESPGNAEACTHVVFAAKNLERLADYTTNLAKTVYYIAAGKKPDKAVLSSLT
jgi:phosphate transport system protein